MTSNMYGVSEKTNKVGLTLSQSGSICIFCWELYRKKLVNKSINAKKVSFCWHITFIVDRPREFMYVCSYIYKKHIWNTVAYRLNNTGFKCMCIGIWTSAGMTSLLDTYFCFVRSNIEWPIHSISNCSTNVKFKLNMCKLFLVCKTWHIFDLQLVCSTARSY